MSRIIEIITQYFQIIVFLLFVVSLAISYANHKKTKKILLYFGNRQFDISSYFNVDATNRNQTFIFRIFNKNVHDLRLASFGYNYSGQAIDLIALYRKTNQLNDNYQVTVQPRDYLTFYLEIDELKKIILTINKGSLSVKKISTYVIDSMGMISSKSMPKMQYYLTQSLKEDVKKRKHDLKKIKLQTAKEKKLERYNKHIENKQKRKDYLQKHWLKFKSLFKK
jgi:hypothetical protein